ncbi:Membrane protein involved in colicin uptake [Devosia sp. DBB001]|nr:Membrane protein involved in colicin uptake [Devosia sp. DBB001]
MTDTVAQPGTVALEPPSTVLNPQTVTNAAGNGAPDLTPEPDNSPAAVMEAELARLKAEDAETEAAAKVKADEAAKDAKAKMDDAEKAEKAKAEERPKAEKPRSEDGKFAKAEDDKPEAKAVEGAAEKPATERAGQEDRQSEGRKHSEPPARFLPEARGKWANVPNEVKAEVHRVSQEYEAELARSKPAVERYEQLRQFDETAKSNGRDLRESLTKVVQVEQALARNPIVGLEMILREIGPRRPDGTPLSLYEVAQHIAKQTPEQFVTAMRQGMQAQQPQQAPQADQKVTALEKQVSDLQTMIMQQQAQPLIERFAAAHPDFHALEQQIADVLKSGVIEKLHGGGLSPEQRLEQAYRMAGGNSPSQSEPQPAPAHSEAENARPVNPDAGTKSVRGAPSDGADTAVDDTPTELRELLRKELRKIA